MSVLALDPGTKCGWAVGEHTGDIVAGTWNLSQRGDAGSMRLVRLNRHLEEITLAKDVRRIVYELVVGHKGVYAAQMYGGYQAVLLRWCEDNGIPCEGVPVGTIKRYWTGKGSADKLAMKAEALRRGFPVAGLDDNAIDALAICHWGLSQGVPKPTAEEMLA